jgi:hypothetical protein
VTLLYDLNEHFFVTVNAEGRTYAKKYRMFSRSRIAINGDLSFGFVFTDDDIKHLASANKKSMISNAVAGQVSVISPMFDRISYVAGAPGTHCAH